MPLFRGDDISIELMVDTTLIPIKGVRNVTVSLDADPAAVTSSALLGWRGRLSGGGLRQIRLRGEGILLGDAAAIAVQQAFFSGSAVTAKVTVPSTGVISGAFVISRLDLSAETGGEVEYTMSLISSGPVTLVGEA